MSINSAILAGVAGLSANTSALSAISENIANVNTVGYKRAGVDFEALVTAANGVSGYSAGGVTSTNAQYVDQQGTTTQTTSPTDLAIAGNGMFVTTETPTDPTSVGQVQFTRAGSFTPDSNGYLKNSAGLYLQGWPADSQGNILSNGSSLNSLQPVNIQTISGSVAATTAASVNANANAAQVAGAAATAAAMGPPVGPGAYDPLTNSMTAYDATTGTGVKPDFAIQMPISDSLGGQHTLQIDLLKSTTPNQWYAEIQAVPTSDIVSGSGLVPGQIATGVVAFNSDGSLDLTNTTIFGSPASPILNIGASNAVSATVPAAGAVNWATNLGLTAQTINLNLSPTSSSSGLTQFDSPSVVTSTSTNGTPFGNLSSVAIDKDGYITATFSNGVSRKIGQVALATFPDVNGLSAVNGDAYVQTPGSGTFSLNAAGSGGAGTIASSTLESSTVDLSAEFTNLIVTQRAYTASSKIITTADQMTQDLLQLIR
jgi:flagellar hook protein FlgE